MKTSYCGLVDSRPYRNVTPDDIRRHPAGVLKVSSSSSRDALVGLPKYHVRIDFDDGAWGEFYGTVERERDSFAAEFVLRCRTAA